MSEIKALKTHEITDAEIIKLYRQGMSQKDISCIYAVSVDRTRRVLRQAGFSTRTFRVTKEDIKEYIKALVCFGCTYIDIENKCDISFHSVREIVEKNDLKGVSKAVRLQKTNNTIECLILQEYETFLEDYRDGCSYVSLCKRYGYDSEQAVYVFNLISDEDIEQHRKMLKTKIQSLHSTGLSPASIASQLDISPSIVRKTIV